MKHLYLSFGPYGGWHWYSLWNKGGVKNFANHALLFRSSSFVWPNCVWSVSSPFFNQLSVNSHLVKCCYGGNPSRVTCKVSFKPCLVYHVFCVIRKFFYSHDLIWELKTISHKRSSIKWTKWRNTPYEGLKHFVNTVSVIINCDRVCIAGPIDDANSY